MKKITQHISLGLVTAILFSSFIYFAEYNLTNKFINTLFGISSLALFLYIPKRAVLIAGFFIGLFWFYWIGYSFQYQDVGYMTPIVTIGFGFIYTLFFAPLAFTDKKYIRAILLFSLSFFEPFDFNWLQIELLFVDSYIGVFKYQLASILFALTLPSLVENRFKYTAIIFFLLALNFSHPVQKEMPLKIKLVATDIKQDIKWKRDTLQPTVTLIFKEINNAILKDYDIVVLPESVFPLYMNKNRELIQSLLKLSQKITIVAGALYREKNLKYNVTYIFQNGIYTIAKKVILVPFGEYIPLPSFAKKVINDLFFSGSSDFIGAKKPTDFIIKGIKFRNAICYEATCQEIYDGDVDFVIAMSNNAWFTPSIEPTLQKLLMKFYAMKNNVTIYHSANSAGTGVISSHFTSLK